MIDDCWLYGRFAVGVHGNRYGHKAKAARGGALWAIALRSAVGARVITQENSTIAPRRHGMSVMPPALLREYHHCLEQVPTTNVRF